MAKRKAEVLAQAPVNSSKKIKKDNIESKPNLLDDSDSTPSSEDESDGGAKLEDSGFKINAEYAKRFEYNKKREDLHKCKLKLEANYLFADVFL